MVKLNKIIILGLILGLLSSLTFFFTTKKEIIVKTKTYDEVVSELKIGDIYIDSIWYENPFHETVYDTITILDIKTNYIQFKHSYIADTSSLRIDYFISNYK